MDIHCFYCKILKRILDFLFGIILFVILIIPMLIISLLILISEGNPVIFLQSRVGQNGKKFNIYKFRTMVKNAQKMGPTSTQINDTRITKLGKILRKTSLDELPQIMNVIKGDMSFIGYRPDVFKEGRVYDEKKYALKPGITGYAQVNGRSSLTLDQAKYWEDKYLEDISIVVDFKILLKTLSGLFNRANIN